MFSAPGPITAAPMVTESTTEVDRYCLRMPPPRGRSTVERMLAFSLPIAALVDLNDPAHYVHWHWFQMSVANVVVILLMIVVFVAAILLPFPKGRREQS